MATVNFVRYRSQSRAALQRVTDYVRRGDKTDGQRYVSGQNCSPLFVAQEFTATRMRYRKNSPVWFYHYTQSFSPGEGISPEQAHALAKEFAAGAWPGSEVLIATHVDARHIHSHFLVNAVCHETGKMLRQGPCTLERLRQLSDRLCAAHGFSVLDRSRRQPVQGISAREYRAAEKGQSWKFALMNVIDDCMRRARTRREFLERMRRRGYGVRWTRERKSITYTTPGGMKCRDLRLHDVKYMKEAMEREFRIRQKIFYGSAETDEPSEGTGTGGAGGMAPDTGGLGRADGAAGAAGKRDGAHSESAFHTSEAGADGNTGTDGGPDGRGGGTANNAPTGWEEERAALLAAQAFHGGPAGGVEGTSDSPGPAGNRDSLVRDTVRLGVALERLQDGVPVTNATTRPRHSDRKLLRREQEKKIAMGHKEDDHEDEQSYQQSM